jgi:CelD/BcsL family acetyltransferase involved in cellulose biosynthesis
MQTLERAEPKANLPEPAGPTPPARLQVSVIRSLAEWLPLKSQWNGFLQQAGIQNLCMTHGWLTTWLQHFPADELLILIVKDDHQRWLGAAPFKISRGSHGLAQKQLRHLQCIGSQPYVYDWMKVAILPSEDEAPILQAMSAVIQTEQWDLIDLRYMIDKQQAEILCEALQPGQTETAIVSKTAMPYVTLPDSVSDYEKTRRKKTRLEVNRHCNRFAKEFGHPPTLEFQPANEATNATLTRFANAHIKYWFERGQKSDFQRFPNLMPFYKDMLAYSDFQAQPDEPRLLFSVLMMNDFQLSYHLGFWQGDRYLSHLTNFNQGFRSYSPGTIHMDKLVFNTIERGGQIFEFGRGDEPYKHMWTKEKIPLWNLRLFRNPLSKALYEFDNQIKKLIGKSVE